MRIYLFKSAIEDFQTMTTSDEKDLDLFFQFDGRTHSTDWSPLPCEPIIESRRDRELPLGDFPHFLHHVPVLSGRAANALSDLLAEHGELLPLDLKEGEYYAFNVTRVVPALDMSKSKISYFESSGRVKDVKRYSFFPKKLSNLSILKIPETALVDVFVSKEFVNRVQEVGLVGLVPALVWSDED